MLNRKNEEKTDVIIIPTKKNMRFSFRRSFLFGIFCIILASFYLHYYFYLSRKESHSYGATSEIIDPFAYPILIKPKLDLCCNKDSTKDILFVVHSSAKNILQRSNYRTTIGRKWLRKYFGFDIIFVVGKHSSPKFQKLIEHESQTYGDILQGDFADEYQNLTIKSIVWIKFIAEECAEKNPIIVKTDDDVIVDLEKLKTILLQYNHQLQNKYFCFSHKFMLIERLTNSPWYVPLTEMEASYKFYDEYCSGFAYITSTTVIRKQWDYLRSHNVHFHRVDDFFVTGKLAAEAKVGHINEPSMFEMFERNLTEGINGNVTFFLMHGKNNRELLWNKLLKKWINNLAKS